MAGMQQVLGANPRLLVLTEFWPEGLTQCGNDPRGTLQAWRALGLIIREIDDDSGTLSAPGDDEILAHCRQIRYTNLLLSRRP